MQSRLKKVNDSEKLTDYDKYYWGYQYRLSTEVLVPYMRGMNAFREGMSVAEIGCAEGGVLAGFAESGASEAIGADIAQSRLENGKYIAKLIDLPFKFYFHDIVNREIPPEWSEKFDLVLLRDVVEHLDNAVLALKNISKMMKSGGKLFVTFPPYNSPFGGHQHTLKNFWGKIPYMHLLPDNIFEMLIKSGREADIGEVRRLKKIRMSPEKFFNAATEAGYEIVNQSYYLLRPVFKMKFGIPPIQWKRISRIDFVRNYLSLEASYILKKNFK